MVLFALGSGRELDDLSLDELREFSDAIDIDVFSALSLERTLAAKSQIGGTSPERVAEALERARRQIELADSGATSSGFVL